MWCFSTLDFKIENILLERSWYSFSTEISSTNILSFHFWKLSYTMYMIHVLHINICQILNSIVWHSIFKISLYKGNKNIKAFKTVVNSKLPAWIECTIFVNSIKHLKFVWVQGFLLIPCIDYKIFDFLEKFIS